MCGMKDGLILGCSKAKLPRGRSRLDRDRCARKLFRLHVLSEQSEVLLPEW